MLLFCFWLDKRTKSQRPEITAALGGSLAKQVELLCFVMTEVENQVAHVIHLAKSDRHWFLCLKRDGQAERWYNMLVTRHYYLAILTNKRCSDQLHSIMNTLMACTMHKSDLQQKATANYCQSYTCQVLWTSGPKRQKKGSVLWMIWVQTLAKKLSTVNWTHLNLRTFLNYFQETQLIWNLCTRANIASKLRVTQQTLILQASQTLRLRRPVHFLSFSAGIKWEQLENSVLDMHPHGSPFGTAL